MSKRDPSPVARAILWLLAFSPAAAAALLVAQHGVNVPVAGDWDRAGLVDGGLDPSPLGERIALPRLVALANLRWFGNDLTLEMGLAYVLVLATAFCVYGLLRRTLAREDGLLYGTAFLCNLLLFLPMQWENFLWAERAWFLFPSAAVCAALLASGSRWRVWQKFVACAFLATAASLTAPHGLSLWVVVFASGALGGAFGSGRARLGFLAVWAALTAAALTAHLLGVARPVDLSAALAVEQPLEVLRFSATLLGSPFSRTTLVPPGQLAPLFGLLGMALFVAGAAYGGRRWCGAAFRDRRLPWLLLGSYALGLSVLAALGPDAGERGQPLLPRYTSISLFLWLASLPLTVLAVLDLRTRIPASRRGLHALLEWGPAFAAGALLVGVGLGWLVGIQGMGEWRSARLQARTSLVFLGRFAPGDLRRVDGRPGASLAELRRAVGTLQDGGYLDLARADGEGLEPFALGPPLPAEAGNVERVRTRERRLDLTGFAWLPHANRRADGVLLTARDASGSRRVIALAELRPMPLPPIPEHDHIYNHARTPGVDETAAWQALVPGDRLPRAPSVQLEAFAVDSDAMRLHPLAARVVVNSTADGFSAELRRHENGDSP